jgi:hypothetical protein
VKPVGKRLVTRDDSIAPRPVLNAAFAASKSQISEEKPFVQGVTTDDGNYAVLAVTQVRNADATAEQEAQRTARKTQIANRLGSEELTAYVEEAERKADIVRNDKVFE